MTATLTHQMLVRAHYVDPEAIYSAVPIREARPLVAEFLKTCKIEVDWVKHRVTLKVDDESGNYAFELQAPL